MSAARGAGFVERGPWEDTGAVGVRAIAAAPGAHIHWRRDGVWLAEHLRQLLGAGPGTPVITGEQVHGDGVAEAPDVVPPVEGFSVVPGVDGLWTRREGVILVARSADCVPVVLAAPSAGWVAAVHAGWRSTKGRIVEKSIDAALAAGIPPESVQVWIGPRIGGDVYEVSEELARAFDAEFSPLGYRCRGRLLDLGEINALQARGRGVSARAITRSDFCTFKSADLLPSFRRDGECRGQIYTAVLTAR